MLLWQIILINVIIFVAMITALRLLFYHNLSSALTRLQGLNRQNVEKEVALNKELERVKQERQLEIERGKEEAKKIKDAARQEAEKLKEQMLFSMRQDSERLVEEAKQECAHLKHEAMGEIQESGIILAGGIIREIFSDSSRQELQKELIDELIVELGKISKDKLRVEAKKAEIVSPYPLLDSQKNAIKNILQEAVSPSLELEERIDSSIISGLVINLGSLILDASLQNKMRKIIPHLQKA